MNVELIFKIFLFAHIAAGSTALLTGLIALILKKKRGAHSKVGYVFQICMLIVALSAFVMAILHTSYFLFVVGVFSFYLTFTGYRSIIFMRSITKPNWLDKAAMILSGGLMLAVTIKFLSQTAFSLTGFSTIILVFDLIMMRLIIEDLSIFKAKKVITKNDWLVKHITRMIPAYIATTTAFLVVNVNYKYPVVIWLAPTVLFVPVIIYYVKKYKKTPKLI